MIRYTYNVYELWAWNRTGRLDFTIGYYGHYDREWTFLKSFSASTMSTSCCSPTSVTFEYRYLFFLPPSQFNTSLNIFSDEASSDWKLVQYTVLWLFQVGVLSNNLRLIKVQYCLNIYLDNLCVNLAWQYRVLWCIWYNSSMATLVAFVLHYNCVQHFGKPLNSFSSIPIEYWFELKWIRKKENWGRKIWEKS